MSESTTMSRCAVSTENGDRVTFKLDDGRTITVVHQGDHIQAEVNAGNALFIRSMKSEALPIYVDEADAAERKETS